MVEKKYPIAPSLIESINIDHISSFGEIAETILDISLEEGILKEIPVFSIFINCYGFISNFRDRLFLRKIALFLMSSSKISEDEKNVFINKINLEKGFKQKVGENLLLLLEKHNNFNKSSMLGKLFAAYIKSEINYDQFNRFANALDYLIYDDIILLLGEEYHYSNDLLVRLHHVDLAKLILHTGNTGDRNRRYRRSIDPDVPILLYEINESGLLFLRILKNY